MIDDRAAIRERGTLICRRLSADVASLVPPGISSWDRAWDLTAGADSNFMVALTAWEAGPSDATKAAVKRTYGAVLAAWRAAVAEYEQGASR